MTLLVLNSVLLLCANVALAVAVAGKIKLKAKMNRLLKWLGNRDSQDKHLKAKSGTPDAAGDMKLPERLELIYIQKSNIKHYIPVMNIYMLFLIIAFIFLVVFRPINNLLDFLPSSVVISGIISIVPLFILDLMARYNSEAVRKRLSEYISILHRWCTVKEDIMYAFEKSLDSSIGEPLRSFIRDMVIQVNRGMDASNALDMLQMKVDNPHFRDFIENIKLSLRHRGNITKLLNNLENQFYRIDEEYNRRNISTYRDRLIIYAIMFGVLVTAYLFINFTPQIGDFYLRSVAGKLLLMVFSGMYALGFYLTAGITKFKH